ncbi:MAG: FAD-dependent oxidoreductase [Spirochaetes bacterium]|nr:FAD-dependent oxidoreductase [Spirochaetota bacterium]MBU1079148.1 FAD-dependent oxidoreductase [Spirochaetota bacterium]
MKRYIVIGGVAGGASTAARLRRLDERAEIILVERGDYISYANCGLPYYAGGVISERERLFVMTPEGFKSRLAVDVRTGTEAVAIDTASKSVTLLDVRTGAKKVERYDALVLSPGAEPLRPPIPGIGSEGIYTLRSVPDVDAIKKRVDEGRPERAVIVGGGFIGLEMAENLHERGVFVTVVEAQDQVMNVLDPEMAAMVHQQLKGKNVELYLSDGVSSFERRGSRIVVKLASGAELPSDIVILSIGVRPDTKIAREAGIALAPNGGILVDERMRTSAPDVYALGDAASFMNPVLNKPLGVPLAGPANKQARVVADAIVGRPGRAWKGAIGTSIAKVFDIVASSTGLSEKTLAAAGVPVCSVVTHGSSHAGYYPGAATLAVKTVFDPESGRLYGAQVVGYDGVDKRIDVLAEAVRRGASVVDLAEFEHAYAPPFSSAKDPVNIAGMAAENALQGLTRPVPWSAAKDMAAAGAFLLDTRTAEEFALGTIPGAVNIPVDSVRARLSEIPRDRAVLVFCAAGLRGYLAERVLRQNGWTDLGNLSGGYKTWELASARQSHTGVYKPGMAGIQAGRGEAASSLTETYGEGSGLPEHLARASDVTVRVDACGLQCPGPVMRLKAETDRLPQGGRVILSASDPGFARDARAWSNMTGNRLVSLEESGGVITAVVEKGTGAKPASSGGALDGATFVVFSDDLDKALASLVLANGAASAGKKPTMFFTFWGLSVIKRKRKPRVAKDLMGRVFSWMLPGHMGELSLSKMNFGGAGALMMKGRMKAKKVDQLEAMMEQALRAGVRLVACQMSMDIMGVAREELIDGVEIGGVATYMEAASGSNVNLFI